MLKTYLAIPLLMLGSGLSEAAIVVSLGQAPGTVSNINLGSELGPNQLDGQVDGLNVLFTGTGIEIQGGGQAQIHETDGQIDTGILFLMPGFSFATFEVNPQKRGQADPGAALLITAQGTSSSVIDFALPLGPGENRLYVQGVNEQLRSVLVEVQGDYYNSYDQPRVGGIERDVAAIPEPTTSALAGGALAALSFYAKRRKGKIRSRPVLC